MHLVVPFKIRLIFLTPDQISAVVLCAFLMPGPVTVKSTVMVMHHSPRIVFQGRPFDPFMPFLLPAYIQCRSVKQGYGVKLEIVQENIAWIEETAKYYWFK